MGEGGGVLVAEADGDQMRGRTRPAVNIASMTDHSVAELPVVSIAVLAFNRRDEVLTTLAKTLEELDYPADRLEAIVVDNASTDGTADVVRERFPAVRVIEMDRNVGAAGWNEAFRASSGAWCLVLDDDCYLEGDGLRRAVEEGGRYDADLVSFRVRSSVEPDFLFNDQYPTGLLSFWGCAALISRRALDRLGGYDPAIFIWANELELTMRLLDEGGRHLFLPEVVAVHMKPPAVPGFAKRNHRFVYRHHAYIAAKLLQPADAVRVLGRLLTSVVLETRVQSPRVLGSVPGVLAGVARALRVRRPVRPEVSALYRDAFMSFASPFEVTRSPLERLHRRRGPSVDAARAARWERFEERRRGVYPRETALLQV